MGNDPIKQNDSNGDIFGIDNLVGAVVRAVVEVGTQVVRNAIRRKTYKYKLGESWNCRGRRSCYRWDQ